MEINLAPKIRKVARWNWAREIIRIFCGHYAGGNTRNQTKKKANQREGHPTTTTIAPSPPPPHLLTTEHNRPTEGIPGRLPFKYSSL
jgi:hypothetical protein